MLNQTDDTRTGTLVSRRTVLGGLVAGAVAVTAFGGYWSKTEAAPTSETPITPLVQVLGEAIPRLHHAAASLSGGRVLVTGGRRGSDDAPSLAGSQIFCTADNTWLTVAPMHTARAEHAAVTLADGRVLVVGGKGQAPLASAEIYDPFQDHWTQAAPMSNARYGHTAVLSAGLVIVTGGFHRHALAVVEVYDIAADRWQWLG